MLGSDVRGCRRDRQLSLQGCPQRGQMPIALDASQARFDIQQGRRQPAMPLRRVHPAIHFVAPLSHGRIDRLDTIGGLEGLAQEREHPQPMQRQGLFQPFRQAAGCRLVAALQVPLQLGQRRPGLFIGRLAIRPLEACAPVGLLPGREMSHHVFSLVPLAPLHQGRPAPRLPPATLCRHR